MLRYLVLYSESPQYDRTYIYTNDEPGRSNMKLNICICERRPCHILSYNIEQKQKHCLDRNWHPLIIFEQNILHVPCTQYNKSLGRTNGAERKTIASRTMYLRFT